MRRVRAIKCLGGGLAAAAVMLSPRGAAAVNFEVSGDVVGQGYEVSSPWGDVVLGKRRLTTTLGLAAYNLQGDFVPFEGDYSVLMRIRVDADFGIERGERSFDAGDPNRFIPGLWNTPVDLMYGYIEGRNIGDGWFGFRVGRQYVTDVLGWWNFDGAMLRLTTPFYVQGEVYGGIEQRGGLVLSTSRFEAQGVWRGSHDGFRDQASAYPSFQFTNPAPAVGAALESTGFNYLHVRWTWRRVYNTAAAFTSQFPAPVPGGGFEKVDGLRLSSERFGGAATAFLSDIGALRGGFAHDLYSSMVTRGYGGLELYPIANRLVVGIDGEYYRPTYDADSIWNWFTHNPMITAQARIAGRPIEALELSGSGGVRLWSADGDPSTWAAAECAAGGRTPIEIEQCLRLGTDPSFGDDANFARDEANRGTTIAPDAIANAGLQYRWGTGNLYVSGMLETGVGDAAQNRGRRGGGQIQAQQALLGDLLFLGGRVSAFNWTDPLRENRDATSFTYVVAPEYRPHDVASLRFEWEHSVNRLVGQRFRALGWVSFRVAP